MLPMLLTALALLPGARLAALQTPGATDERQIHWQRSLDDALELSRTLERPLLVAINADGESASERIVRERYRDPQWIAHTRSFVCVVASVFRHTPRDHADTGERVPCPRFGEVTCDEHIALEPAAHGRWLAGKVIELFGETTERISPRHVLVSPQGEVLFDRYLLFEMSELDDELAHWAARFPPRPRAEVSAWEGVGAFDPSARSRLAFEDALAAGDQFPRAYLERVRAARTSAPRGAVEWLWRLGPSAPAAELAELAFVLSAPHGELESARAWLRTLVRDGGPQRAAALGAFGRVGAGRAGDRTLFRSFVGLGRESERRAALEALPAVEGEQSAGRLRETDFGVGAFAFDDFLEQLASATPQPSRRVRERAPLPPVEALETRLAALEPLLRADPASTQHRAEAGRALLALARVRIAEGAAAGVDLMLNDASEHLARASDGAPEDLELLHERARAANLLSRFDEQERLALLALELRAANGDRGFSSANSESLRWLADACARRLAQRSGGDAADEITSLTRGAAAFALAARAEDSDDGDWVSLSSYFGALGRGAESEQLAFEGLRRFPASPALWAQLYEACASLGRPARYAELAEQIADSAPDWPEPRWYAGQARLWLAQWDRRGEAPERALENYGLAEGHFARALELAPHFRESCEHYLAMGALGRGFAHLMADRRARAAECVVEAARIRPQALLQRDGLEREGVDLIDGVLELRARGRTPVDSQAWLAELERADPGNAYWARSIGDAQLREAIRAYERKRLELGDWHIARGIEAARSARAIAAGAESDAALAQALTVFAERLDAHGGDFAEQRRALEEAAGALGLERPSDAAPEAWRRLREELRARLGPARPVFRAGR